MEYTLVREERWHLLIADTSTTLDRSLYQWFAQLEKFDREMVTRLLYLGIKNGREEGLAMAKDNSGKAPNTGSNTQAKNDNKATQSGKPVDPNRPHVDKDK